MFKFLSRQREQKGDPVLTSALRDLSSENYTVRTEAVEKLKKQGTPLATESVMTALQSPNANVRQCAAIVLLHIGNHRAVESLCSVAVHDPERFVREPAVMALARLKDRRSMETLLSVARP
jgi:HEAT repeat protein